MADAVRTYLALVDAEAAGPVEGLSLTGSAARGDFRPAASDIDFVAVMAARPDAAATALQRVHLQLRYRHRRPFLDGRYVTWDALAHDPASAQIGWPRSG